MVGIRRLTGIIAIICAVLATSLMIGCGILSAADRVFFQIQVVDEDTGRGIPLVEIETLDNRKYVSDSAGRIAIGDPGLINRRVFFTLFSHGYEMPEWVELELVPGGKAVIKAKRINIAERIYRITGIGIYRDSVMLGEEVPIKKPVINAEVTGQDSGKTVIYKGKIYWHYGDTGRLAYSLGNFQWTVATSELPSNGGLHPSDGVDLAYFEENGFTKKMCPFALPGANLVWATSTWVMNDENGEERMWVYYTTLNGSLARFEHGIGVYNDEKEVFERYHIFDLAEEWRIPGPAAKINHVTADGKEWLYITHSFPGLKRVPADIESIKDPSKYEAWTCLKDGSDPNPWLAELLRDEEGNLVWRWTSEAPPVGPTEELGFIQAGLMDWSEARFLPVDVVTGKVVNKFQNGTIVWNPWRQKWILIGGQLGGDTSTLGEIWYSEADEPTGPWKKAIKIVTHKKFSLYNPMQVDALDQEGGRIIYFHGTYANSYSGVDNGTPYYNGNTIMYRLDLADPRLDAVRE